MILERASGVLLHISSLPSEYGIGDMGHWAYRFADLLAEHHQSYWQILPLNPTSGTFGHSPYSSFSAFAGNFLFISPYKLVEEGLLPPEEIEGFGESTEEFVNFEVTAQRKKRWLQMAYQQHFQDAHQREEFEAFRRANADWLEDMALFATLKERYPSAWSDWPIEYRDRDEKALQKWRAENADKIGLEEFTQYIFFKHWRHLKEHCAYKGIKLIGDIPIYVSYDSADTWANTHLFKLDEAKKPIFVAGAPPDYFSETGQRWGNPVYDWQAAKEEGYTWWIRRLKHNLAMFDLVRLDHFRGFAGYWEIPAEEETAVNGHWAEGPAMDLFQALRRELGELPIIAEDLGVITPDVRDLLDQLGFPGMKILLFAFGWDLPTNPYAPHNIEENSVVYTGTHDNNTVRGWFEQELSSEDRERLLKYLGHPVDSSNIHWALIRLAMISKAKLAIFPLQDLLGLDERARFNLPATKTNNWSWRALPKHFEADFWKTLGELTYLFGRQPSHR